MKTFNLDDTAPQMPEPFVSADAAEFLSVKRRYVLELARRGIAGAYPLGTGRPRKVWVSRLSELASAITKKTFPSSSQMCDPKSGWVCRQNLNA